MPDEIPEADAYKLQYQNVDAKGSGEWRDHKITPHRSVAEDFLDSSPEDCASRVTPLYGADHARVTVEGMIYRYESREEWEAAAL